MLGGSAYPELLAESGADVVSVDWRISLTRARAAMGAPGVRPVVQGNLDPAILLGAADVVRERVLAVLEDGGGRGHIFNLGHGLLPSTSRDNVGLLFDTVRSWTPP